MLVLAGFGSFGLHALFIRADYLSRGAILRNRRFHFTGVYIPPADFKIKEIARENFKGRLYVSAGEQQLLQGREREYVRISGRVKGIFGGDGFSSYLQRNGYHGVLEIDRVHGSKPRAPPGGPGELRAGLRNIISGWFESREIYWPLTVSFLRALVLGERGALGVRLDSYLRRLGIVHLFVISGLHVGILSWIVISLLKKQPPWLKFGAITFFLVIYIFFLGFPLPALRAGLMVWLGALALFLERETSGWSILVSAVFILSVINPFVIFDAGFQLTAGAVVGIFLIAPYGRLISSWLPRLFVYNLGAFFGVLPAVIYHFNYFPRLGFIFSFLAGLMFLPLLILLVLQVPLMLVNWTFFADFIEGVFLRGEQMVVFLINSLQPLAAAPGAGLWPVVALAAGCWLLLDSRANRYVRAGGFVLIMVLMVYMQLPPHPSHLAVYTAGDVTFTHLHLNNADYLILPRGIRLDPYRWRQIESKLAEKGTFRLTGLISDYPPGYLRRLDVELVIENYYAYWQNEGIVEKEHIGYDFENHRFHSTFGMISYNNPPGLGEEFDPSVLVGVFNEELILINKLDKISSSDYEKLLNSGYKLHLVRQKKFQISPAQ